MMSAVPQMVRMFGVLTPLVVSQRREEKVRFRGPRSGKEGVVWEYVAYPSWAAAARDTGLSIATLRWKLERR